MKRSTLTCILLLSMAAAAVGQTSKVFVDSFVAFNQVRGVVTWEGTVGTESRVALHRGLNADETKKAVKVANIDYDGQFDLGLLPSGSYTVTFSNGGKVLSRFPLVVFADKRPLHSLMMITASRNNLNQMEYSAAVTTVLPNKWIGSHLR